MSHHLCILYIFLATLTACQSPSNQGNSEQVAEWKSLFNGENLDGWVVKINGFELGENIGNTFRVEEGMLKVRYDEYDSYDQKYGAIIYQQAFSDYRLKVEYRFVGDTATGSPSWGFKDSGIQYHGQAPESIEKNQPFIVSLEYNLHGGNGEGERPTGEICTIGTNIQLDGKPNVAFCTPPAVKKTFHGDEWVTAEIEVKGEQISHWVNGEKVLAFSRPTYDPMHEFGKKIIQANNMEITSGYISLQSNSHPIEFRTIEIQEY